MPLIPLKSIPPGRIEDSNPGIPGFRSAAAEAGSAGTLLGFGKNPENRLLGIIIGVYAGVSMLAGFITHRLGGFPAQDTLTYSTINIFAGISVILLAETPLAGARSYQRSNTQIIQIARKIQSVIGRVAAIASEW